MKIAARTVLGVLMTGFVALAGCEIVIFPPGLPDSVDEDFNLSTEPEDVESILVQWRNGKVVFRVDTEATEVSVTGTKTVSAPTEGLAEDAMDDFEIRLFIEASEPGGLIVQFDAPEFVTGTVFSADVEVVVPAGVALKVENLNGDVDVAGNTANTQITLGNGDVTVDENVGSTGIAVANGGVQVIGQEGDVEVDVSAGDVEVTSNAGNVDVHVGAGSVDVEASPGAEGELTATTEVGSVVIRVDADTAASLDLHGTIGSVTVELEDFTVTELTTTATGVTAILNGGGGQIVGTTNVGSVDFGSR